jgi:putative ATP-dependent endonuclease of OLD family
VSVTPPRNLIVLRRSAGDVEVGVAREADLTDAEWEDIARYLDATRGELVFARSVLLVEGFAEAVLLPKLAADADVDLDKAGVTVCAIHGTHFGTYARYLSALGTPWAVITDGDPDEKGSAGQRRAARLLKQLDVEGPPEETGIFVGEDTFEADLAVVSTLNGQRAASVLLKSRKWSERATTLLTAWEADGVDDTDRYMKVVEAVGKGRFAQRLASTDQLEAPDYVAKALAYLTP